MSFNIKMQKESAARLIDRTRAGSQEITGSTILIQDGNENDRVHLLDQLVQTPIDRFLLLKRLLSQFPA
jgi:hypothetical protein